MGGEKLGVARGEKEANIFSTGPETKLGEAARLKKPECPLSDTMPSAPCCRKREGKGCFLSSSAAGGGGNEVRGSLRSDRSERGDTCDRGRTI